MCFTVNDIIGAGIGKSVEGKQKNDEVSNELRIYFYNSTDGKILLPHLVLN